MDKGDYRIDYDNHVGQEEIEKICDQHLEHIQNDFSLLRKKVQTLLRTMSTYQAPATSRLCKGKSDCMVEMNS